MKIAMKNDKSHILIAGKITLEKYGEYEYSQRFIYVVDSFSKTDM